ncbi:MAG TPA: hypothetical protein VG123_26055, partial [Streptosporangiaceae bacterium]|nr:hypothetical protein [Streptosporangiaceae bacterium]
MSKILLRITGAACIPAVFLAGPAAAAAAQTQGVRAAAATSRSITVTSLKDSGPGSLRAAIQAANSSAPGVPTAIGFSVHGVITL